MREWIIVGSIFAVIGVLMGAFGSHGLKTRVTSEDLIIFETGVRYQMYHAIGLIILGVIGINFPYGMIQIPGYLFSLGILLFSGSLYLLVITNIRWFGAVTPIGGLCFIAGWILLSLNIYKS